MRVKWNVCSLLSAAFFLSNCVWVLAQGTTASMNGSVLDVNGAAVPGATVSIKHVGTSATRISTTDDSGRYVAVGLPVGDYEVRVEHGGFAPLVRTGIKLNVDDNPVIDVTLNPGEVKEDVVVSGGAPLVETTSTAQTQLVDEREIRELPLNGRGYAQLIAIQPGVQTVSGGGGYQNVAEGGIIAGGAATEVMANGQKPENNLYLIDGTEMNTLSKGTPLSGGGDMLGVEALREFKVLTHTFDATYGQVAGAVVLGVSRSGTNEFHGSAFYFRRDDAFDARNFFDREDVPPFKRDQFGGVIGGPVVRDRMFFFVNYEGLREKLSQTRITFVPDAQARQGIVPGQTLIDIPPHVRPFLDLYPLPNGSTLGNGLGQYSFIGDFPRNQNQFGGRIDHKFSDADTMFARYTYTDGETKEPLSLPIFQRSTGNRYQYLTIGETHIFSPTIVNQLTLSGSRTRFFFGAAPTFEPGPEFFAVPSRGIFPQIDIGAVTAGAVVIARLGVTLINNANRILNVVGARDDLTITRGRHTMTFGGELKRYEANDDTTFMFGGFFSFPDLSSFLRGRPAAAFVIPNNSEKGFSYRQKFFSIFAQDNFKWSRRLTLNLGLRYEISSGPVERYDRLLSFDYRGPLSAPPIFGGKMWENLHGIAPRLGLAWDPTGSGKTSVRIGAGFYYNHVLPHIYAQALSSFNLPHWSPVLRPAPPFPVIPDSQLQPPPPGVQSAFLWDHNLALPTSVQYNVSLQRELFENLGLSLTYAGSHNTHGIEGVRVNLRQPVSFTGDNQPIYAPGRPRFNSFFGEAEGFFSDANSNYNAMIVSLDKRLSGGLQFSADYTFSKLLSDFDQRGGSDYLGQHGQRMNLFNRTQDRARARFDVRHKMTISGLFELPYGKGRRFGNSASGLTEALLGGWQLSTIFNARTGLPITPIFSFNRSLDGSSFFLSERPSYAPGVTSIRMPRTATQWFDASAFVLPPAGTYGNVARGVIDSPGLSTLDLSLMKTFKLTERQAIDFRWEVFNSLNHTNLGAPNNIVLESSGRVAPTAGIITQTATTSRQMQFSAKYRF